MPNYKEQPSKYNLFFDDSKNKVKITVDGFNGVNIDYTHNNSLVRLRQGESRIIAKASNLRAQPFIINGDAYNPNNEDVSLKVTVEEEGTSNKIIYNFPKDYTGIPDYIKSKDVNFCFFINFT